MPSDKITHRSENLTDCYNKHVIAAEFPDSAPILDCMVVHLDGWTLWEKPQATMVQRFKETGHINGVFSLSIPMSSLEIEKKHVEGSSPKLVVVNVGGGDKLDEPFLCIPLELPDGEGRCIYCGEPAVDKIYFTKAN